MIARGTFRLAGIGSALFPLLIAGCAVTDDSASGAQDISAKGESLCSADCVVDAFTDMARLFHPSKHETALSDYVVKRARESNGKVWNGQLEIVPPDALGNLLIRVPATGEYAASAGPSVALQAHMDMVLAHTDAPPGTDPAPLFKNGVDLVKESIGGKTVFHSRDFKSTIGADDTAGCGMELRYILDGTLTHPALELLFTVQEELGLIGAEHYNEDKKDKYFQDRELKSKVFISLDGSEDSAFLTYGTMGGEFINIAGAKAAGELPPEPQFLQIDATGLLGGHSGLTIFKNQVNAVQAIGEVLDHVLASLPEAVLVRATAGDPVALNKVPNGMSITLALPGGADAGAIAADVTAFFTKLVAASPSEPKTGFTFHAGPGSAPATVTPLDNAASRSIAAVLKGIDNGVVERDPKADAAQISPTAEQSVSGASPFPHGILLSSNIGFVGIGTGQSAAGKVSVEYGFMPRAFDDKKMVAFAGGVTTKLGATLDPTPSVTESAHFPGWISELGGWLPQLLQKQVMVNGKPVFTRQRIAAGGAEISVFAERYKMTAMLLGTDNTNIHTVKESVSVEGIHTLTAAVDDLLLKIGKVPEFKSAK